MRKRGVWCRDDGTGKGMEILFFLFFLVCLFLLSFKVGSSGYLDPEQARSCHR